MARIILGIHGLGNKPDKDTLTQWWRLSIQEGLDREGYATELPHFEMVYWADILYPTPFDPSITDPHNPYYVDEKYTHATEGYQRKQYRFLKSILRFAGKKLNSVFLDEDFTLKYSFIPDYIISRYFRDLDIYYTDECESETPQKCQQKELIKQRLAGVLEKYKDDEILLIAHSMGSIIAFDVIGFLAPESKIHTLVTMGSPLGLPLAVSKIAAQYKSSPSGKKEMRTPAGIYGNWFNYADVLDKITLNYRLSLRYKFNKHGIKPRDFNVANDYHNHNAKHNPHKSFGYLRTPEFAYMLNQFLRAETNHA